MEIIERRMAGGVRRTALDEFAALLANAGPLMLSALANMGIAVTDIVMMGWIGPHAVAAGAAASDFYSIFHYLALGIVGASAPLIASSLGAGRADEVGAVFRQTLWVVLLVSVPGAVVVWHAPLFLGMVGVEAAISAAAAPYARMMALAFLPMAAVLAWRHFLTAHGRSRDFFLVTVAALPLNAFGNWVLMFGHLGLPAMGLAGAGASSALVAVFMFVALTAIAVGDRRLAGYRLFDGVPRPDPRALARIFRLGVPIGITNVGEMGVFLFATVLAGSLGVEALAAHAVALRMAGVLYAVPMGLSHAAAVRVGFAAGAGAADAVRGSTRVALLAAAAWSVLAFTLLMSLRPVIATAFLGDDAPAPLLATTLALLTLLALMQPFDVIATVITGILRGLKETRAPMWITVAGYWGIGFTALLALTWIAGHGIAGLWSGLFLGCVAVSSGIVVFAWRMRALLGNALSA